MDFQELIRVRRSVRGYKPDPVDEDVLRAFSGGRGSRPPPATCSPST